MYQSPFPLCSPYVSGQVYVKDEGEDKKIKLQIHYSLSRMHMHAPRTICHSTLVVVTMFGYFLVYFTW